jgi:hypothetical protein
MAKGQYIAISASYSITKRQEVVKILDIYLNNTYEVEYPSGHTQVLPIGAFIG